MTTMPEIRVTAESEAHANASASRSRWNARTARTTKSVMAPSLAPIER